MRGGEKCQKQAAANEERTHENAQQRCDEGSSLIVTQRMPVVQQKGQFIENEKSPGAVMPRGSQLTALYYSDGYGIVPFTLIWKSSPTTRLPNRLKTYRCVR